MELCAEQSPSCVLWEPTLGEPVRACASVVPIYLASGCVCIPVLSPHEEQQQATAWQLCL